MASSHRLPKIIAGLGRQSGCRQANARLLHSSTSNAYPRRVGIPPPRSLVEKGRLEETPEEDWMDQIPMEERDGLGSSSMGHLLLRQQRDLLKYLRLIEHDMPNLVQYRKPFVPPPPEYSLVVRTINYAGEEHPATAKRVVVVPISRLPLKSAEARHTFKLLAGQRWWKTPPKDSGLSPAESDDPDGYIKISCEDFPQPGMNLKWISDVLDRLIAEANAKGTRYASLPLDTRHIQARERKGKKVHGSLSSFPEEWLPSAVPA